MALIDELKEKQARIRAEHQESRKKQDAVHREMDEQFLALNDLARAIAALEAPAQPVHPEAELRTDPGSVEEVRDQFTLTIGGVIRKEPGKPSATFACDGRYEFGSEGFTFKAGDEIPQWMLEPCFTWAMQDDGTALVTPTPPDDANTWTPTVQPAEITVADLDKLATKASPEERAEMEGRDALAEFMKLPGAVKWEGGECPVPQSAVVEYLLRGADLPPLDPKPAFLLSWDHADILGDIIAYRVVSEPAEQYDDPTAVAIAAYIEAENEAPAPEQDASVQIEPSPYAEAVSKGAITQDEADFLISERERIAADEQAKFFAEGMMADADRHQSDQRGIVGVLTGMFKREREDA